MYRPNRLQMFQLSIVASLALAPAALADNDDRTTLNVDEAPISELLRSLPEEVQLLNQHLTTLSDPFMEGRLPGTFGMEVSRRYMEYYWADYGLEPAFEVDGKPSWRQPFELGSTEEVTGGSMTISGVDLVEGKDYVATGMGGSGDASGDLVFVGYSINNGPDGYSSYGEDDDLTGKVAVMLRYEPMDDQGVSLWSTRGPWSGRSSFRGKVRAAARLNPSAIIIINTPGADDPRVDSLNAPGGSYTDVPVMLMAPDAALRLFKAAGTSIDELREAANEGGGVMPMRGKATCSASIQRKAQMAENVGAMVRGKGDLADEIIVVGAHLDHLGMGEFGSRSGPGELHPGSDDNASGAAGILLFGKWLVESYNALPDDADARTVIFIAFDAEESGLNGARFYSDNPIGGSLDNHVLMINFDMIGRILNGRLSVSGSNTGEGMAEWLAPYYESTPLTIVQPQRVASNSDHAAFFRKQIPVLFGIIADFHDDYHTPRDTVDKINRVATVETIRLFHRIVLDFAQLAETFPFVNPNAPRAQRPQQEQGPGLADIKVRFGVVPASYDDTGDAGIPIRVVSQGGSAEKAGLKAGDIMTEWNGTKIESMVGWMEMLAQHDPGDIVYVTVIRDGEEKAIKVTLQPKGNAGG